MISAGSLYGTTGLGGASGDGTVFKLKFSAGTWTESVMYNFAGGTSDGSNPYAGLLLSGGVFYGTTFYGGAHGDGTVFSLTPSGSSWAEYSGGSSSDGTVFSLTP